MHQLSPTSWYQFDTTSIINYENQLLYDADYWLNIKSSQIVKIIVSVKKWHSPTWTRWTRWPGNPPGPGDLVTITVTAVVNCGSIWTVQTGFESELLIVTLYSLGSTFFRFQSAYEIHFSRSYLEVSSAISRSITYDSSSICVIPLYMSHRR